MTGTTSPTTTATTATPPSPPAPPATTPAPPPAPAILRKTLGTVTLTNRLGRPQLFHLSHLTACTGATCSCLRVTVGVRDHERKTGKKSYRAFTRRVPTTITLLAAGSGDGVSISGLPHLVVTDPVIAAAIKAKTITWVADPPGTLAYSPGAIAKKAAQEAAAKAAHPHGTSPPPKPGAKGKPASAEPEGKAAEPVPAMPPAAPHATPPAAATETAKAGG